MLYNYFALKPCFTILYCFVKWHGWYCVFFDISCVQVDSIFYSMLLLLISVCLRYPAKIWLHRYKNMHTNIILLYNLMCLEFWEGLYYFGLIACFTALFFSYIVCFLGFWERPHCFAWRTYFTILQLCYIVWVTIIFLLFIVEYCSMLHL